MRGVRCPGRVAINSEIIENLRFLLSSAKERNTEQGIKTFASYLNRLSAFSDSSEAYKELYRELSGMQRFADFNNKEWQAVKAIFNAIEANQQQNRLRPADWTQNGLLKNCEPLSQVWFVHDYIQLQFQDQTVTIMNTPELKLPSGVTLGRNDVCFCDTLVSQIEQSIQDTKLFNGQQFTIKFESGIELVVPLTAEAANGPEALKLPGGCIVFNT